MDIKPIHLIWTSNFKLSRDNNLNLNFIYLKQMMYLSMRLRTLGTSCSSRFPQIMSFLNLNTLLWHSIRGSARRWFSRAGWDWRAKRLSCLQELSPAQFLPHLPVSPRIKEGSCSQHSVSLHSPCSSPVSCSKWGREGAECNLV